MGRIIQRKDGLGLQLIRWIGWLVIILLSGLIFGPYGTLIALCVFLGIKMYLDICSHRDWINPIFLYSFFVLIATLADIKVIYLFNTDVHLYSFRYARPEFFFEASLIWAIGNLALIEGYRSEALFRIPSLNLNVTSRGQLEFVFWFSLAMVFQRFWLPVSPPGAFQNIINLIPLLGIALLARVGELMSSKIIFYKAFILTVLTTGMAVLFSFLRIEMIIPGIVLVLGTLSARGSLKALTAPKFIPLYGFLALFITFFTTFGAQRSGLSQGFARFEQLRSIDDTNTIEFGENRSLSPFERSSSISQVSAVAGLVKENGLYKGEASKPLITALIPRFLWPEKPKIALGVWFAVEIGTAIQREDGWYNNSINMTIPGNLYIDFGWVGLIVGGWLTGAFLKVLWRATQFDRFPLNMSGALLAIYLLYRSFTGIGENLQILITLLAVYLIVLALDRGIRIIFPQLAIGLNQYRAT